MYKHLKIVIKFIPLLFFFFSCEKESFIIDEGNGITIEFIDGLNDDLQYKLSKNSDGFYEMIIDRSKNQTIQRISGRLLRNGNPVWETLSSGQSPKKVNWESNLYWWLLDGDIVANITYTYFNEFTGELEYVNLPPIINWEDELVPTINESSYSDSETGIVNTVVAPIREMVGDTMKIKLMYTHSITQKEEGSNFFGTMGEKVFKDSVYVI